MWLLFLLVCSRLWVAIICCDTYSLWFPCSRSVSCFLNLVCVVSSQVSQHDIISMKRIIISQHFTNESVTSNQSFDTNIHIPEEINFQKNTRRRRSNPAIIQALGFTLFLPFVSTSPNDNALSSGLLAMRKLIRMPCYQCVCKQSIFGISPAPSAMHKWWRCMLNRRQVAKPRHTFFFLLFCLEWCPHSPMSAVDIDRESLWMSPHRHTWTHWSL